jgi:hypothetical protein
MYRPNSPRSAHERLSIEAMQLIEKRSGFGNRVSTGKA